MSIESSNPRLNNLQTNGKTYVIEEGIDGVLVFGAPLSSSPLQLRFRLLNETIIVVVPQPCAGHKSQQIKSSAASFDNAP